MNAPKKPIMLAIALALLLFCSLSAFAQGPPGGRRGGGPPPNGGPPPEWDRGRRPPDQGRGRPPQGGPGFNLVSSEMRFDSKIVKGASYSAQAITESTQALADGTRITRKATSVIYRDNEGRTRRELTIDAIASFGTTGEAQQLIFINDPVTSTHYVLYPQSLTARKMNKPAQEPPPYSEPTASATEKTESLGKKTIEGVEAEGTRSTITIPAGQIGNDRPITIVSERWYSAALQAVVLSKHSDPRVGENIFRLTNISRTEPAKSLFEVPENYKVEDESQHRPPKRDHRKPDDF